MSMLFDLDGTLLDTAPEFAAVINIVRAELGLPPLLDSQLPAIRNAVSFGIKALTEAGFKDHLIKLNKIDIGEAKHLELCDKVLITYQENLGSYTKPFPGILDLLATLEQRNIPWGIVTNKKIALADTLLERVALKHRAACIVGGDSTPYSKPHPEPLLYACQKINRSPEHCIYIGDAKTDIEAAHAANMKSIAALFGYVGDIELAKKWGAHHFVEHADHILPWANQWL